MNFLVDEVAAAAERAKLRDLSRELAESLKIVERDHRTLNLREKNLQKIIRDKENDILRKHESKFRFNVFNFNKLF